MRLVRWLANSNQGFGQFPHNFWSSYEYLIHYQSEDLHAHSMVRWVPPIMSTIEPRMVIIIRVCSPFSCKHMVLLNPVLEPHQIMYHSNLGVR